MDIFTLLLVYVFFVVNKVIQVDARYCKYELDGLLKYYMCPRNEYCCNIGCCISPTFQFYQLWYYWLMVIFMFVVCSGGQWWYRYWMNERYVSELRTMPHHHHHHHHHQQVRAHPGLQQHHHGTQSSQNGTTPAPTAAPVTRVSYHPQTQAVFLDNLWKPTSYPGRVILPANGPPPSYSASTQQSATSGGSGPSGGLNLASGGSGYPPQHDSPKPSPPYTQIYGPPPSYESVVGLSSIAAEVAQQARVHQQQSLAPPAQQQQNVRPSPPSDQM